MSTNFPPDWDDFRPITEVAAEVFKSAVQNPKRSSDVPDDIDSYEAVTFVSRLVGLGYEYVFFCQTRLYTAAFVYVHQQLRGIPHVHQGVFETPHITEFSKTPTLDVAVVILAGQIVKISKEKDMSSKDPLKPLPLKDILDPNKVLYFVAQNRCHNISGQGIDQLTLKGHPGDTLSWRSTTITFGSKYLVPLYNFEPKSSEEEIIGEPKIIQLDPEEYAIQLRGIDHEKKLDYTLTQPGLGIWRSTILRSDVPETYNISFMIIGPKSTNPDKKDIVGYYSFETKLKFTDK